MSCVTVIEEFQIGLDFEKYYFRIFERAVRLTIMMILISGVSNWDTFQNKFDHCISKVVSTSTSRLKPAMIRPALFRNCVQCILFTDKTQVTQDNVNNLHKGYFMGR